MTIHQLQERFGAGYVIDVLRGSRSIRIQQHHKSLPTYAILREQTKETLHKLIQELVEKGYIVKTKGMYPLLTLAERALHVMEGKEKVMLTRARNYFEIEDSDSVDQSLVTSLKSLRTQLAREENVPAYIVLSDASLLDVALYLPTTPDQLRQIQGFGEVKIKKYGKQFCEAVASYCKDNNNIHRRKQVKVEKLQHGKKALESDTKRQTLFLHQQGYCIEKIAAMRGLTVSTVETHLAFYIERGELNIEDLLTPEQIATIRRAINIAENRLYSTIRAKLPDEFSFGQIRLVMADLMKEEKLMA
jgi:ATP-dependent DNA helicase RecQ